jgi:hypothetical protein
MSEDERQRLIAKLTGSLQRMPEHTLRFLKGLWKESPRGALLVVGASCDEAVETLLRATCVDVKQVDELLDSGTSSPLGSFGARIKACWCFGLLPEDEYFNLEQVRKMRNYVAHNLLGANLESINFDDNKIKQHIAALRVTRFDDGDDDALLVLAQMVGRLWSWVELAVPIVRSQNVAKELACATTQYRPRKTDE